MVKPLSPLLQESMPEKDATEGIEHPLALLKIVPEDPTPLLDLANFSIDSLRFLCSVNG